MNILIGFLKKYKNQISFFIPTLKIPSVISFSLSKRIKPIFMKLKQGIVLDVGGREAPYKKQIPYTKYMILDVDKSARPDILGDAHNIPWESYYFDTVISIDTLEHVKDPHRVIDEVYRVLKNGGVCVLAVPLLYPYHPGPEDHYRFTRDSLLNIFQKFRHVEIYHYGNRLQVIFQFLNYRSQDTLLYTLISTFVAILLNIFNPIIATINFRNTKFPFGFIIYAEK